MNLRSAWLIVVTLGVFVFAGNLRQASAKAKDITITKDDQTESIECSGRAVTVKSNDNKITLKGDCKKLTVSGDDNTISATSIKEVVVSGDDNNVAVDSVGKINTKGNDNNIAWKKGLGGKPPAISTKGEDNNIKQTAD